MKRRVFLKHSLALASGLGALSAPALAQGPALRFGLTPVFLSNDLSLLNGLEEYFSNATGSRVELIQKRTYQEITTLLVAGRLDAAWICGYPFIRFQDALELLSVPVWRGRPRYQAYLIGAAGRDASSIDDLAGDLHCFSDPDSNSGYLVTTALLAERNMRPDDYFRKTFFAYGHRNVVRAVASKLAQSGSVDGYVWEVLSQIEPELTAKTTVISKSDWLGFPPIAAPKAAVGTPHFAAIRNAILNMHLDPLGKQVLDLLKLDSFGPPEGTDFAKIAGFMKKVRDFG
ncbi:MAG: PhnD/SsuA/transferrin family substrate-binding protein [Alphaproteobacteria bacterium]|nr:PhnD/SsuA/transferrin family substrate-binding protein [Alphaproteobacteria bacterium]